MDRAELYDTIAARKLKPKDYEPYSGGNGRVDKCVKFLKTLNLNGKSLVDIGGGIGDLGSAMRDIVSDRTTVDISWDNLHAAQEKGNKIIRADVDTEALSALSDLSADVITALDFIEHIIDPENFARECFRILRPGGYVYINTPNIQYYRHLESMLHGVFPHTSGDREIYHGGHLAFYNFTDMVNIFGAAGFTGHEQLLDEETYSQPPEMFIGFLAPKNQEQFKTACMRLGNSNLLYTCRK